MSRSRQDSRVKAVRLNPKILRAPDVKRTDLIDSVVRTLDEDAAVYELQCPIRYCGHKERTIVQNGQKASAKRATVSNMIKHLDSKHEVKIED